jgi:tRNA modification GTPase
MRIGFLILLALISLRQVCMFALSRRTVPLVRIGLPFRSVSSIRSAFKMREESVMGLDTIFALSSAPVVKSGVAVVRISGPSSHFCLEQLTSRETTQKALAIEPRKAALKYLYAPDSKEILDQSLVLWFPGPRSFTGEDVVELHVHGSRAVIKGIFEALEHLDDPSSNRAIRPAARGEFTRRAFDNGKMDLTEVEGLSDLLDADTSEQRKQALRQMDGHLRKQYEAWRYEVYCIGSGLLHRAQA